MYEYNRSTGIASTRYRPLQTPRLPGFSFHNHRSSHAIQRPCRSSHQLLFQGESNPKTPIPILRVLTLAYARVSLARAFRPAQKDTPLHSIRRTHAEPIRTTHRAALQHSGTRVLVQAASHQGQGSARRICPAPCPPHPQKPMLVLLPAARIANGTGRATRHS